jgi:4-carboxymuconolactone decarboxylase
MSRLSALLRENLDADQLAVLEGIVGGKRGEGKGLGGYLDGRGAMRGPFNAMVHRPDLGIVMQRLGEVLRFEARLPGELREIGILVVAAHWRARYEWWAHARIAREEGVDEAVIEALARGETPALASPDARALHAFARELVEKRQVGDGTCHELVERLGEDLAVELVILLGYYTCVSMILNAFDVALPEGETTPFDAT